MLTVHEFFHFIVVYIICSPMLNVVRLNCVPKFSLSCKNHNIREGVSILLHCGQIVNKLLFCCATLTCSWHGSSKAITECRNITHFWNILIFILKIRIGGQIRNIKQLKTLFMCFLKLF
jgi:hypothetical protein